MSCQQVPRLTEDPYAFTEAAPVTGTLFNPQVHKLTPIFTSPASQKQKLNQKPQQQQKQQISPPSLHKSQPQIIKATYQQHRVNGHSTLVNGVHKSVMVTTTTNTTSATTIHNLPRLPPQLLQPHSANKITNRTSPANPTTKKFLPPPSTPPPAAATLTPIYQSHPFYSIAKTGLLNQSTTPPPPPPVLPLPPLFQRSTSVPATSSASSALLPVHVQRNHSSGTKQGTQQLQDVRHQKPQSISLINSGASLTPINQNVSSISQQQHGGGGTRKQSTAGKNARTPVAKSDAKRKSTETAKPLFVTPGKRETRALSVGGKKSAKAQNDSSSRTNKRSYSQSAHHEPLQRIQPPVPVQIKTEWHAPDAYIFDSVFPASTSALLQKYPCNHENAAPLVQHHWLNSNDIVAALPTLISREQRIELRKAQLRRQAMQFTGAKEIQSTLTAKRRLLCVLKALRKLKDNRAENDPTKKCCFPTCSNDAVTLTAYCYLHITRNMDQHLFLPCTAKFSDNSQCRVPVFDISHELPLCREHAWKRDNYNRIIQEQKPKKPPRKRQKAISRPQKRNKKKKKSPQNSTMTGGVVIENNMKQHTTGNENFLNKMNYQIQPEDGSYITSHHNNSWALNSHFISGTTTQDMMGLCENSSAYESSEDTGVGGLSETELMSSGAHDVIESIPLGDTRLLEEHDITNVLNQLPEDAFNDLFTTVQQNGTHETSQEEQEYLERALETVNETLQQMAGGDESFLTDLLDVDDPILDDSEVVLNSNDDDPEDEINASTIIVSGGNGSNDSGNIIVCNTKTAPDIRNLVLT